MQITAFWPVADSGLPFKADCQKRPNLVKNPNTGMFLPASALELLLCTTKPFVEIFP
jgi:hypothetical protein